MANLIDLTGQVFGKLTVIEKDNTRKSKTGSYWLCQCSCGNYKSIRSSHLRNGSISSCGCYRKEKLSELKTENLIGQKFGMLIVISKSEERSSDNRVKWNCLCDCGKTTTVLAKDLKKLHTTSCGCCHKSLGETIIEKILQDNNINYISQYKFLDLKNRYFDFAILNNNNEIIRLIEFDGEQHYKEVSFFRDSLEEIQKRDEEKNKYAEEHKIPLIRIPYWEIKNITLEKLLN